MSEYHLWEERNLTDNFVTVSNPGSMHNVWDGNSRNSSSFIWVICIPAKSAGRRGIALRLGCLVFKTVSFSSDPSREGGFLSACMWVNTHFCGSTKRNRLCPKILQALLSTTNIFAESANFTMSQFKTLQRLKFKVCNLVFIISTTNYSWYSFV